jgi:hypothetical protein
MLDDVLAGALAALLAMLALGPAVASAAWATARMPVAAGNGPRAST